MNHGKINADNVRVLGEAQGVGPLYVQDTISDDGSPVMVTAWFPTDEEIIKIVRGAPVLLIVLDTQEGAHPMVDLNVGAPLNPPTVS